MNSNLLTLAYRIFPFLPAIYALGAYLIRRPVSRRALWLPGLLVAALEIAFATAATRKVLAPIALTRLVAAWTILYALPMIGGVATVVALRRRARLPQWIGAAILIGVCAGVQYGVQLLAFSLLGIVEASG